MFKKALLKTALIVTGFIFVSACAVLGAGDATLVTRAPAAVSDCMTYESFGTLSTDRVRVATWNVFKGQRLDWHDELERLHEPDTILMLQEAPHGVPVFEGARDVRFAPGFHTGATQTGVLTSAHVSPVRYCRLQHHEPWLRTPKASLVTQYALEGRGETLMVANIHAINFTIGTDAFKSQLRDLVAILEAHDGPMILAGDFNTWNSARVAVLNDFVDALDLQTVDFDGEKVKHFLGYHLDHIFYRQLTLDNRFVKETESSDHNLLLAEFAAL